MSEDQATTAGAAADWRREQAGRYLSARFGAAWTYKAPETFENLIERRIWSVACGAPAVGETCVAAVEAHLGEREA